MDSNDFDHPLRPLVSLWLEKIRIATERKRAEWEVDALDAMAFFRGPYQFLYEKSYLSSSRGFRESGEGEEIPSPSMQLTTNLVAEGVQIFGATVYHRNPHRQVNPRRVPIPPPEAFGNMMDANVQMFAQQAMQSVGMERARDQSVSQMMEFYLNFTPNKLNLERHARLMVDEALITGLGLLWPEVYQPPGSAFRYVGSFWRSSFDLQMDPDMNDFNHAQWAACRRVHPVWMVERKFGLKPGSVKANYESAHAQAEVASDPWGQGRRARGETCDLVVYWEIYSKMGLGGRLRGCLPALKEVTEQFGDYCYLVIAEGTPFPLNLPSESLGLPAQQLAGSLQWPTPHWRMGNWPFASMILHPVPGRLWPMGHFTPAMGELKFLNWAFSFIASKMRTTCRDFIAIAKSAGEELKNKILHGRDLTLIEVEKIHGTIAEVVQFLQHPQMNADMFKVLDIVRHQFERRTGLTELMALGQADTQDRSATESNLKASQMQVRPDDMRKALEAAMSQAAGMEALTARVHLQPQDLAPVLGPVAAQFWQMVVGGSDLDTICHGLEYRIEANSTSKPNKDRDRNNYQAALQTLVQPFFQLAGAGQVQPFNTLLKGWAESIDLNPEGLMIQPPLPPPMPPPAPDQGQSQGPSQGPSQGRSQGGPPPGPPQRRAA